MTYFLEEIRYNIGHFVYKQGDSTIGVYMVRRGDFQVSKKLKLKSKDDKSSRISQDLDICIISKNGLFGHLECFDIKERITSVK